MLQHILKSILALALTSAQIPVAFAQSRCEINFSPEVKTQEMIEVAQAAANLSPADRVNLQAAETFAMDLVGKVALTEKVAITEISNWVSHLKSRQANNNPLTVTEHSALMYLHRSKFFDQLSSSVTDIALKNHEIPAGVAEVLTRSWKDLTGKAPAQNQLVGKLPLYLLMDASSETRAFYTAALRGELPRGHKASLQEIADNYIPRRKDLFVGLSAILFTALAFKTVGLSYLVAPMMGVVVASLAEYIGHRFVGHKRGAKLNAQLKGWWKNAVQKQFVSHGVIHHGLTFKSDYSIQFDSDEQKEKVDAMILKMYGPEFLQQIQQKGYGLHSTNKEVMQSFFMLSPLTFAMSLVFGLDPIIFAELAATSVFFVGGIHFVHPYVHMTRTEFLAATENKPITRWFFQTRYASLVAGTHFVHTRDQSANFSFGVLLGDILGGTMSLPTMADFERMRRHDYVARVAESLDP